MLYDKSYSDNFPIEKYSKFFSHARSRKPGWGYTFWSLFAWPQAIFCRLEVRGIEKLPTEGPMILAPNHTSDFDPFLIMWILRRVRRDLRIHWFVKTQLLRVPIVGWSFYHASVVPVRRGREDDQTFEVGKHILGQGRVAGVFPEGGLSSTGEPSSAKWGIGRLALITGVAVVPVALRGTKALRNPKSILRPPKVTVEFGQPLNFPISKNPSRAESQQVANAVFEEIKSLYHKSPGRGHKLYLPSWLRL